MTTNNDTQELKFAISSGASAPQGTTATGFHDPTGTWPRETYFNSSNLNFGATHAMNTTALYTGGADNQLQLDLGAPVPPKYPLNQVSETISGHIIEINDTPGGERILIKHTTGAGIELHPDGTVVVASTKNMIQISGADQTILVDGEANLVYKGNLNLKVMGDFNVDVAGNYNVKTSGNKSENIIGSDRKNVNGNQGNIVKGSSSTTVLGATTNTHLGSMTTSVQGSFNNQVQGDASYVANGTTTMSSGSKMNMSSADVNLSGSSISVFGASGTIGGEGVHLYGYNAHIGHTVYAETMEADTFYGDLKGYAWRALTADVTNSQNYADPDPGGGVGSAAGWTIVETATDGSETALPNGQNVTDYLTKSSGGVRRVQIDPGDFIRNTIDKTEAYAGIWDAPLSTTEVRSVLRDPANAGNSKFVGSVVSESALNPNYFNAAPQGIGRVVNGGPTATFGQTPIGQGGAQGRTTDAIVPRRGKVNIIPDPRYNPMWVDKITSATRLAPGITIAKFLSGSGDTGTLANIADMATLKNLARHYYVHAQFMRSIQTNTGQFADLRIGVAEGMYMPGPSENVTAGGINDLKTKGRAVVYEIYDSTGNVSNFHTFNLAAYWKDSIYFDKLILSYDQIEGKLKAQVIVILPEISDSWTGTFNYAIETHYNNKVVSTGELVECMPVATSSASYGGYSGADPGGGNYSGENGRLDPTTLTSIGSGHRLRGDAANAYLQMVSAAQQSGISWSITDSYRTYEVQVRLAEEKGLYSQGGLAATPGTSNHGWGLAVDLGGGANTTGTPQNNWLVANANRFGFFNIPREPWHWEYRGVGV